MHLRGELDAVDRSSAVIDERAGAVYQRVDPGRDLPHRRGRVADRARGRRDRRRSCAPVRRGRLRRSTGARASVRPASRPTSSTSAPSCAYRLAAANPRPLVAPVTATTRPVRSASGSSSQANRARRAAYPSRLKLPTTVSSSAPSTATRARCEAFMRAPSCPRRCGVPRRRGRRCDGTRGREAVRRSGTGPSSPGARRR